MCWWTYRLMVNEGNAALFKGVANHFGATTMANFVYIWGEQFWQLPQGELSQYHLQKDIGIKIM